MTIPTPDIIADEQTDEEARREEEEAIADNFLHIICFLCYPAFASEPVAPHEAQCICGKPVHKGDSPGPDTAPACILCTEMAQGHYRKAHAKQR
jgi:hypothetical protein